MIKKVLRGPSRLVSWRRTCIHTAETALLPGYSACMLSTPGLRHALGDANPYSPISVQVHTTRPGRRTAEGQVRVTLLGTVAAGPCRLPQYLVRARTSKSAPRPVRSFDHDSEVLPPNWPSSAP